MFDFLAQKKKVIQIDLYIKTVVLKVFSIYKVVYKLNYSLIFKTSENKGIYFSQKKHDSLLHTNNWYLTAPLQADMQY